MRAIVVGRVQPNVLNILAEGCQLTFLRLVPNVQCAPPPTPSLFPCFALCGTLAAEPRSNSATKVVGPVLCLDEFLEMEDPRVRRGVEEACAGLCAAGVTIVFATHVMEHVDGMVIPSSALTPPARSNAPGSASSFNSGGNSFSSGGNGFESGGNGRVVSFSRGRAGELSPVEDSTYVKWKKGEAERRLARKII